LNRLKFFKGNVLELEPSMCEYIDYQTMILQEMPENAATGQIPRVVNVECTGDLADQCAPGDRVKLVGIYRCVYEPECHDIMPTVLIVNHISRVTTEVVVSEKDISECKKLSRRSDIFELLVNSVAPTILGQDHVKAGILCLMLGGVEQILFPSKIRLRGDINVMLIGDPSMAKSQFLRFVLHAAPRAIAATGRCSSGVGLTAGI